MTEPSTLALIILIAVSLVSTLVGLYLLTVFNHIFKKSIKNEIVRKNAAAWLIILCLSTALQPMNGSILTMAAKHGWLLSIGFLLLSVTISTLLVYNIARIIEESPRLKKLPFIQHKLLLLLSLIITTLLINIPTNYFLYGRTFDYVKYAIFSSIYVAGAAGLIYTAINYIAIERKRKFDEKELELSRMRELKTKAELDALHSKVNPHFLYNALNSIADLSITDGKKGRKMTIALADLFRYSINYSDNNFSTIKDEVEMADVYLQIEKIRFEDNLTYTLNIEDDLAHYLIPRFVLQPLVENAVKHGLKATGRMTEIQLEVNKYSDGIVINIADNGPDFPDELLPGYGVKSVYDKMDLLFKDKYEIHFINKPQKKVSVFIQKLIKDESTI